MTTLKFANVRGIFDYGQYEFLPFFGLFLMCQYKISLKEVEVEVFEGHKNYLLTRRQRDPLIHVKQSTIFFFLSWCFLCFAITAFTLSS